MFFFDDHDYDEERRRRRIEQDRANTFVQAASDGDLALIKRIVVEHPLIVNSKNEKQRTALHMATTYRHIKVVDYLIKCKAFVNITDKDGFTALHMASQNGDKIMVEFLLKHKANVKMINKAGISALHTAAFNDKTEVMDILLKNKAVVNKANCQGAIPLHLASYNGKHKAVELLLKNKANINQVNDYGDSALMNACVTGKKDIVTLLLRNGADTGLINQKEKTAKDMANEKNQKDIVKIIDSAIADLAAKKNDLSDCYPMRTTPGGSGVVAILANFTGQLKGYNHDVERISRLFKDDLGYSRNNVLMFKDMCEDQFMANVQKIQDHVSKAEGVDRLFIFIMSHGDRSGILMCQKASQSVAEKKDGKHVSVSLSRVIARFQPDETPALKGLPKVFIVQKCNGSVMAQAAEMAEEEDDEDFAMAASLTDGPDVQPAPAEDTLQCQASCPNTRSYVTDNGSVYIQKLCEEFEKNYRTKHVSEMLTAANQSVMETKTTVNGVAKCVSQMPQYSSSLTKKIRLYMD